LNRRPADYETTQSSQIAENSVHACQRAPATELVVAEVEQVSEQVGTPSVSIAAEVEQAGAGVARGCVCNDNHGPTPDA
jgi:hypothetical protein